MVVSKDAKRKRKDSPLIESSPEMPKRTKVQAQRKFAQGQSAPSSSYSSALASSSAAASSSSTPVVQEPPTELLPNKRPKTEDFLTFLCFRGTSALPAHLDFLNQNSPPKKESAASSTVKEETTEEVNTPKTSKQGNNKRKGRVAASSPKASPSPKPSTSTASAKKAEKPPPEKKEESKKDDPKAEKDSIMPFAVRKRAGKIAEGNRKGRTLERNTRMRKKVEKKDDSRRSMRTRGKVSFQSEVSEEDDDEEDDEEEENGMSEEETKQEPEPEPEPEHVVEIEKKSPAPKGKRKSAASAKREKEEEAKKATKEKEDKAEKNEKLTKKVEVEEAKKVEKAKKAETVEKVEVKAEKVVESKKARSQRDDAASTTTETTQVTRDTKDTKERGVKRPRQKESPIFVPSNDAGGRMTRQRAFFEPVKVPHRDDEGEAEEKSKNQELEESSEEETEEKEEKKNVKKGKNTEKDKKEEKKQVPSKAEEVKSEKEETKKEKKLSLFKEVQKDDPPKTGMDVFEFSSDDEEPLSRKVQGKKKSPKKATPQKGRRGFQKKTGTVSVSVSPATPPKAEEKTPAKEKNLKNEDTESKERKDATTPKGRTTNLLKTPEKIEKKSEPEVSEEIEAKPMKKKPGRKKKLIVEVEIENKEEKERTNERKKGKDKKNDETESEEEKEEAKKEKIKPKGKRGRKRLSDVPPPPVTEVVEEEETGRSRRPTRKTKEAATIYMELIGQKLNLDESEDDNMSMNSYPELPNVKETEKMETELRKNLEGKQKQDKKKKETEEKKEKPEPEVIEPPKRKGRPPKNQAKAKAETKKLEEPARKLVLGRPLVNDDDDDDEEEDFLLNEEVNETKRKLEKSFSDSDDEPLAIKLTKNSEKDSDEADVPMQPTMLATTGPLAKTPLQLSPPVITASSFLTSPPSVNLSMESKKLTTPPTTSLAPRQQSLVKTPQLATAKYHTPPPPTTYPPPIEAYPSPKINPNFLTPKFDRNLDRRIGSNLDSSYSSGQKNVTFSSPGPMRMDSSATLKTSTPSTKPTAASGAASDPLKDEIGSILAASCMPSKEESGKIFGIASVSLAQSSGPDNTKCTLGKCGSIHKPALGPVVPTESYLGEQLSSKERRKAKVNMTHEQIQKWLIECSSNPDDIQDDLDEDCDDKQITYATTPPPIRDDKESTSFSSSSKTTRDLGKSESAWSGKGPSLKATPVALREDNRTDEMDEEPSTSKRATHKTRGDRNRRSSPTPTRSVAVASPKNFSKTPTKTMTPTKTAAQSPDESPRKQPVDMSTTSSSRRQALYNKQKLTESPPTTSSVTTRKKQQAFGAFSANNEKSIYSFDKEDDHVLPLAKPYRRQSGRRDSTSDDKDAQPSQNSISVTLSPEENNKLVKVSLDTQAGEQQSKAADNALAGDSDSEGHTFYIPLQGAGGGGIGGGKSDLIQGVAVKVGREGPEGPNQKVIMHATLVTKAQMGTNPTPIPDSMNVSEIVKNFLSSSNAIPATTAAAATTSSGKDAGGTVSAANSTGAPSAVAGGSKSVPVGTVQPRFKSSQDSNQNQNPSGSGLIRVNSNSSLFSGSNKSRGPPPPKKFKDDTPIKMSNNTAFPRHDDPTQMVEAPVFRPTEKEFQDPMEFIERITPIAARFGICKIIPPASFKPECRVSDDMRFTAYNQYVHKMLHRWGPSAKELSAIKKYLATQSIMMTHPPWIGGMEVDLPRLYHTVQELGGLKEVIEKKKWAKVAEEMCIPKLAQDRVTKLDDIYCKYLLPYDTLSPTERQKLFDEVEADWAKREARARRNADRFVNTESVSNEDDDVSSDDDDESEEEIDGVSMECIVKGRNMPLSQFFRIARNTMALWFKNSEPTATEVEAEFWRHVAVRDSHVCVNAGSIDSSGYGYGFPAPGPKGKGSPCAKHPWNLKVLTNNPGSVLRSLGPVMGVTVPTLHVGMLFSACCWYRDPHGLSWIEYLHTGASKIWYGIPDDQSSNFRSALTALIPTHCQNKTIWLPCDTAMVPPHMLTDRGVSLCRTEQKPGEFVVIFPRAYTSSVATGYVVSESVYFATSSWLDLAKDDFRDIHDSCEPAMFSLEQLLFSLASDQRVAIDMLSQILPMIGEVFDKEVAAREQLKAAGVTSTEKVLNDKKGKQKQVTVEYNECDLCRANLYISMVKTNDGIIYCLQHALKNLNKGNIQAKQCKLIFAYNIEDIENLIKSLKDKLSQKRSQSAKKTAIQGK